MLFRPVWFIWSYPQNYLSIRMSLGDYSRLQSFRPLLRLIQNQERITRSLVEAVTLTGLVESLRAWSRHTFIKRF